MAGRLPSRSLFDDAGVSSPVLGVQSTETDGDVVYVYDGTLEGFLTCIFTAFERKQDPFDIVDDACAQIPLFATVCHIATDQHKAQRVLAGISKKIGRDEAQLVKLAFLNDDPKRGVKVLRYLQLAMRYGRNVYEDHANPVVADYEKLWRQVSTERHHMLQFARFRELEGGVFFSKINPKANVVPAIMDHFARRFNTQPFIIYDEVHHVAGVSKDGNWSLVVADSLTLPKQTEREDSYSSMWRTFYETICNKERLNPGLRVHWMPKRLWSNIVEMVPPLDGRGET